jgi:hypothetical protein
MAEEYKKIYNNNLSRCKITRLFELDIRPGKTGSGVELLYKVMV